MKVLKRRSDGCIPIPYTEATAAQCDREGNPLFDVVEDFDSAKDIAARKARYAGLLPKMAVAPKPEPVAAPAPAPAKPVDPNPLSAKPLAAMTQNELIAVGVAEGISVPLRLSKADMISTIEDARKAKAEAEAEPVVPEGDLPPADPPTGDPESDSPPQP